MNDLGLQMIPLDQLVESPFNPWHGREDVSELAASIRRHGLLQPVLVRPRPTGVLELVHGHRRFRAAQAAGLTEIPAKVRELDDIEALELAVIENVQRENLHPLDEGELYARMHRDHGLSAKAIAEKVGKSKSWVYDRMRLAGLSDEVKSATFDGRVSVSVAGLIAALPTKRQRAVLDAVVVPEGRDPMRIDHARYHIDHIATCDLRQATWTFVATMRDEVGKLPACDGCMYRAVTPGDDGPGRCLDTDCFDRKRAVSLWERMVAYVEKGARRATGEDLEALQNWNDPWVDLEDEWASAFDGEWVAQGAGVDTSISIEDLLGDPVLKIAFVALNRSRTNLVLAAKQDDILALAGEMGWRRLEDQPDDERGEGEGDEDAEDEEGVGPLSGWEAWIAKLKHARRFVQPLLAYVRECPRDRPFWLGFAELAVAATENYDPDRLAAMARTRGWLAPEVEDDGDVDPAAICLAGLPNLSEAELATFCVEVILTDAVEGPVDVVASVARRFGIAEATSEDAAA